MICPAYPRSLLVTLCAYAPVGSVGKGAESMRRFVLMLTAMILALGFDTNTQKEGDEELLNSLQELDATNRELWRYFSERADSLAQKLWTTGTWIFAIIGAALGLPFATKFIVVDSKKYLIRFESPLLAILVCIFGLLLCAYSYVALNHIRELIERNWARADLARNYKGQKASWRSGRKLVGWRVLMMFGAGSVVAFVSIIALALLWTLWTDAFLRQS
jgi:hypothetical protein